VIVATMILKEQLKNIWFLSFKELGVESYHALV